MKLPKEMQKKQNNKPKRPTPVKKRPGQQQGSRAMRRKMQQQGIDMDQIEATRVIIESPEKTIVINQPEVVKMEQMGQSIFQIIGTPEEYSPGEIDINQEPDSIGEELNETIEDEEAKPTIAESDIMLVAAQANVGKDEAEAVLRSCDGNIAKAIVQLKNR
ncbi:MAG: Nascent polypeptide-associated complex protein [Candidatus Lokiarchaeota archaeon]|nr:Nascent polypeptide-associated complex protein [Candidatus Lokiarchaeota archaeon]